MGGAGLHQSLFDTSHTWPFHRYLLRRILQQSGLWVSPSLSAGLTNHGTAVHAQIIGNVLAALLFQFGLDTQTVLLVFLAIVVAGALTMLLLRSAGCRASGARTAVPVVSRVLFLWPFPRFYSDIPERGVPPQITVREYVASWRYTSMNIQILLASLCYIFWGAKSGYARVLRVHSRG